MTPLSNSNLRQLLAIIQTELRLLAGKILVFREVFGPDKVVALVNNAAPEFFGICSDALFDDLVLSTTRLIDRPATAGHFNASIGRLVSLLKDQGFPAFDSVVDHHKEITRCCKALLSHRNERIAHLGDEFRSSETGATDDPAELFGPGPLPGINLSNIEEAFQLACTLVSKVCIHLDGQPFVAEPGRRAREAGPGLLRLLSRVGKIPNDR